MHAGDHSKLVKELVKHKAFFTENEFWALPYDDNWSSLPLRMDSRVVLYRETEGKEAKGFTLFDTYAVMGGAPITNRQDTCHKLYR